MTIFSIRTAVAVSLAATLLSFVLKFALVDVHETRQREPNGHEVRSLLTIRTESAQPHLPIERLHGTVAPQHAEDTHTRDLPWSSLSRMGIAVVFPFLGFVIVLAGAIHFALRAKSGDSHFVYSALFASLVSHHVEGILFTWVLSDSFAIAHAVGRGAVFSGLLIGLHKFGTAFGSAVMWCGLQCKPDLWRSGRSLFRLAFVMQLVGNTTFALVGFWLSAFDHSTASVMLVGARFVTGFGGGLAIFLALTLFARILPAEERSPWNVAFFVFGVSGLGVGPLGAAATLRMGQSAQVLAGPPYFESILPALCLIPLVQVPCLVCYSDLDQTKDHSTEPSGEAAAMVYRKSFVVACCVVLQAIRNLTISTIESGITLVLEDQYRWNTIKTGLTIAVSICCVFPANGLYNLTAGYCTQVQMQRALLLIMLFGSVVMIYCHGPLLLLIGGTTTLASAAISAGLIISMLQKHVLSKAHFFDLNRSMLLIVVGCDLLGRGCGPIAARAVVEYGGKSSFAVLQLAAVIAGFFVFEAANMASPLV